MNIPGTILCTVALLSAIINEISAVYVGEERVTAKTLIVISLAISGICTLLMQNVYQ